MQTKMRAGSFSLGTITPGAQVSSVGEFALERLIDTYDFTLTSDQTLEIVTEADPTGLFGGDADTEIAVFDSNGILLGTNDDFDDTVSLFSALTLELPAGDYTVVVGTFDTVFADGPSVTAGLGLGDYALSVNSLSDFLLGDVNVDGTVDFLDIAPFIAVLTAGGSDQAEADINGDGIVDFLDIAPFIAILN